MKPQIKIIGIGGYGLNILDYLIKKGFNQAEFIPIKTDANSLQRFQMKNKVLLGKDIFMGKGTNGVPELGKRAALAEKDKLEQLLMESDVIFVVAGMGGGTGSGATPVIAQLANELNIPIIAIVTILTILKVKKDAMWLMCILKS